MKRTSKYLLLRYIKIINHLNPEYEWAFFTKKDIPYNLHSNELCIIPSVNSQPFGINSLSFRGIILWNALCDEIKLATSINEF